RSGRSSEPRATAAALVSDAVVMALPGMDDVVVRPDIPYRRDPVLHCDLYLPPRDGPHPCAVFVHGDGPPDALENAKDWGQYTSWGRLSAASGMAAVTFNHRSTEGRTNLDEAAPHVDALGDFCRAS